MEGRVAALSASPRRSGADADSGRFRIEVRSRPLEKRNDIVSLRVREQPDKILHKDKKVSHQIPLFIQVTVPLWRRQLSRAGV